MANIVGGGTPSTKESSYWNGDINWFTPNEIGDSKYVKDSLRRITEKGLNNSSAQLLPANKTILFTSRATIGTIGILEEEASTNQGFQSLIVNDFNDVNFLYYKLLTMKKLFLKNSVGSTFLEISGKTMKKIDINIPSKTEQEKIGKLLSKIDKAISLHKRKIYYMKFYFRFLNQYILEDNEPKRKLRFKNYRNEWLNTKLEEITYYKNGKGHEEQQKEFGNYELVNLNSVSLDGVLKSSNQFINSPEDLLIKNDIVMILSDIAKGNLLGKCALIDRDEYYVLNQRVALLRPRENINSLFLKYFLNNNQKYFKSRGQGTSQLNLSKKDVVEFRANYPSIDEQGDIANYLLTYENLLVYYKNKIKTLEKLKILYLDKMFI